MPAETREVTSLLERVRHGDALASDALVGLLYEELRRVARRLMARERHRMTLQPTALVHEAYMRLVGDRPGEQWNSRAHFLAAAAGAMRRVLIERARQRARVKRGGDLERVTLDEGTDRREARPEQMIALDAALDDLTGHDPTMARVVELRYFGGLTVEETSAITGLSPRSVNRSWTAARAWLRRELATKTASRARSPDA